MNDTTSGPAPCTGIRVLEIATMVAGPMAGLMLADLGAEVIKIEPLEGDPMRNLRPRHLDMSAQFMAMNRHKKSVRLNLKSPKAQAIARKLALETDVLIENSRPGVMERLGLSYESLRQDNPGLIYISISGFGPDGPYAKRAAYDQVIQAMSGIMHLQGRTGDPEPLRTMIVDKYTASAAASAATAALLYRERHGGIGQKVSVSLVDAFSSFSLIDNLQNKVFIDSNETIPYINTTRPLRTADGFVMGWFQLDQQFEVLCRILKLDHLIGDERFKGWNRFVNMSTMWNELEKGTVTFSTADLTDALNKAGFPLAKVNTVEEFIEDPQTKHNKSIVEYDDPEYGRMLFVNYPVRFGLTPARTGGRSPKLGEHTDSVLAELGHSTAEIQGMKDAGDAA
jgi:CoA:oxalate CoA-transferase